MFLFCSLLQYILLWLKINFKGLPVFMYAQFLVPSRTCVHICKTRYCVRAKRERTLILAGLPVANVRSRVAFRIWVSGLLLASP